MPTNDSNPINSSASQTSQQAATAVIPEVDLDMSVPSQNASSSFDFTLDLPDSFTPQNATEQSEPAISPVQEPSSPLADTEEQFSFSQEDAASEEAQSSSIFDESVSNDTSSLSFEESIVEKPMMEDSFLMPEEEKNATVIPMPLADQDFLGQNNENMVEQNNESILGQNNENLLEQNNEENQNLIQNDGGNQDFGTFSPSGESRFLQMSPQVQEAVGVEASTSSEASSLNVEVSAEMDPFEAMRTTLSNGGTFAVQEQTVDGDKALLSDQVVSEPQQQVALEPQHQAPGISHLDMPIAEPTMLEPKGESSASPVVAMENVGEPAASVGQMLSLDEMIAQPAPSQAPMTMDLDMMAGISTVNPLNNPVPYPQIAAPQIPVAQTQGSNKAIFAVVGSLFLLVMVAFVGFLRYPTEIAQMLGMQGASQPSTPVVALNTTGEVEHNAAELTGDMLTGEVESGEIMTGDAVMSGEVEFLVDASDAAVDDQVQEVVLEGAEEEVSLPASEEIQLSGEKQDENSDFSTLSGSDSEEVSLPADEEVVDALGAVEDLVGTVGNADVLMQEIDAYKLKSEQLVEQGRAQEDPEKKRTMIKNAGQVLKDIRKLQEELANGKKMSISEWNTLKAEFDISFEKAQNAG